MSEKYTLIEKTDTYSFYRKNDKYSVYYLVEGKKQDVLKRIEKEQLEYHPCGYGTKFDKVNDKNDDWVVYTGWRSQSCD